MSAKVSVVVPIYKVEKYIDRCINSIVKQTYTNLEIILVNDGSPDNCGAIIDQFALEDNRVIAIHKENGGLSDARNYGVRYVTGEFTLFVDSDDWLASQMIETLVGNSIKYKADIVQSAFYYAYENYLLVDNRYYEIDSQPILLDNKKLMLELVVNERVKNFAWGKLYKTDLIKDIPFEKGVLFEDVYWAHKVMHKVSSYLILNQPLFYYYQRKDSIIATYTSKNLDVISGLKLRHEFIKENYQEYTDASLIVILQTCLVNYNLLLISRNIDKKGIYKKSIQNYIKLNYQDFKAAIKNDNNLLFQLVLFSIHPCINVLYVFTKKALRKLKVLPKPLGLKKISL